jgi:hypothetical protein
LHCQRLSKARAIIPDYIDYGLPTTNRDLISHEKNIEPVYLHIQWNESGWEIRLRGGILHDRINQDLAAQPSSLTCVLRQDLKTMEKLIFGTYWDFGLLEHPRTGGTSVNAELAQI